LKDPRLERLAHLLVEYSLRLKEGDLFRISGSPLAIPLIEEVYRAALHAGAHPYAHLILDSLEEIFYREARDFQLEYVSEIQRFEVDCYDALLGIYSAGNTKHLAGVDPERLALAQAARRELTQRFLERSARGELRWCGVQYPTPAHAQEAGMSLADYEEFVFRACKLEAPDPIAAWEELREEQARAIAVLEQGRELRILAPETELTLGIAERGWINASGEHNMPDGEIFTAPVEDQVDGQVEIKLPLNFRGREVRGVRLVFRKGQVVEAHADEGEDFLRAMLQLDEGASRLGELGFGMNYDIERYTKNVLFDEKLGGTVHLALGAGYPETGSRNRSALHWDMILDLREEGEVYLDGERIFTSGKFLI